MSSGAIDGLTPAGVWQQFHRISQIPRCSGDEVAIRDYIIDFAKSRSLKYWVDSTGNLMIKQAASQGYEGLPGVILQGHMDMVCEKDSHTKHNFDKDPLTLLRDGDWLSADGTTLGADNGIAVAMILALMEDPSISHGPLEALFTVDEETGLIGACGLDPVGLEGKILVNLDSEEMDTVYIGCAGGCNTEGMVPVSWEETQEGCSYYTLAITGLKGGHSGAEIHREYANSLVIAGCLLDRLSGTGFRVASITGGGQHNVIPRECFVGLVIPDESISRASEAIAAGIDGYKEEYSKHDAGLKVEFTPSDCLKPTKVITDESQQRLIALICAIPNGVIAMDQGVEHLVRTSTNLARLDLVEEGLEILTSQRSTSDFMRDEIARRVTAAIRSAGGRAWINSLYPGWDPNLDSPLLERTVVTYESVFGCSPKVAAIHAGLECGVVGAKIPGLDMISFGPDLEMVHTPKERIRISSVARIWQLLVELLATLDKVP